MYLNYHLYKKPNTASKNGIIFPFSFKTPKSISSCLDNAMMHLYVTTNIGQTNYVAHGHTSAEITFELTDTFSFTFNQLFFYDCYQHHNRNRISYLSSLRNIFSSDGVRDGRQITVFGTDSVHTDYHLLSLFWHPCGHRSRGTHNYGRPDPFLNNDPASNFPASQTAWIQTRFKCSTKVFHFKYGVNRFALLDLNFSRKVILLE
jgi:hypothetical protein